MGRRFPSTLGAMASGAKRSLEAIYDLESQDQDPNDFAPFAPSPKKLDMKPYPDPSENTEPMELIIRGGHDPQKILALLAALLGLFLNGGTHEADRDGSCKQARRGSFDSAYAACSSEGGGGQEDPKTIVTRLAVLLGLSSDDGGCVNGTQPESAVSTPISTPLPKGKPLSTSGSPISVLSSRSYINSGEFKTATRPSAVGTFSRSPLDSEIHQDSLVNILHQSVEYPAVRGAFHSLRAALQPILLAKLKKVTTNQLAVESGLETAASIDLLKLFNSSNPGLENIAERAREGAMFMREGAMLMQEGEEKVNEGKNVLESALSEIHKHIKGN